MTHRTISVNHKKKGGGGREKDLRSSSSNTHTFQQVTYLQKTGLQGSELSSGDILKKKREEERCQGSTAPLHYLLGFIPVKPGRNSYNNRKSE